MFTKQVVVESTIESIRINEETHTHEDFCANEIKYVTKTALFVGGIPLPAITFFKRERAEQGAVTWAYQSRADRNMAFDELHDFLNDIN